jgi:hypothetical protein
LGLKHRGRCYSNVGNHLPDNTTSHLRRPIVITAPSLNTVHCAMWRDKHAADVWISGGWAPSDSANESPLSRTTHDVTAAWLIHGKVTFQVSYSKHRKSTV